MNEVFGGWNAAREVPLIQLEVKLQKTAEIRYLEQNKQ